MLLYGINSIVFCMIKGHLEIVCRTKFHMSVGKTKFYAMKLACACIVIIILLMLVSMWLHRLVSLPILMLYEVCYPAGDGILHMDCVHWGCPVFRCWYDLITAALSCLSFFQSLFLLEGHTLYIHDSFQEHLFDRTVGITIINTCVYFPIFAIFQTLPVLKFMSVVRKYHFEKFLEQFNSK